MKRREKLYNRRQTTLFFLAAAIFVLAAVTVSGILVEEGAAATDYSRTNLDPGIPYLFGTDWMALRAVLKHPYRRAYCGGERGDSALSGDGSRSFRIKSGCGSFLGN